MILISDCLKSLPQNYQHPMAKAIFTIMRLTTYPRIQKTKKK